MGHGRRNGEDEFWSRGRVGRGESFDRVVESEMAERERKMKGNEGVKK